jgi:hypothetical protein
VESYKEPTKYRAKTIGSSATDPYVSSSDHMSEEEVTRPMDRDRAKAAVQKGNECSSSHSKSSFAVGDMMSTMKKLSTAFAKTQLWKLWNKLKERSTANIDEEELQNHRVDLRLIEKYINFDQANEVEVEHEDENE